MDGEKSFKIDNRKYEIPNAEMELSTIFRAEEQKYHSLFIPHDSEPLCAHRALEPSYLGLSWQLGKIENKLAANREYFNKLQRDLVATEAAKLIADDVEGFLDLVSKAKRMAAEKRAFVAEVRSRAVLPPKPDSDQEVMLRMMSQQMIRAELSARYAAKALGTMNQERTTRALASVGKTGDADQDLFLLEAVRQTTLFEPSEGGLSVAEARFIEAYRPWVNDLEAISNVIDKWTQNRMSFEAMPALKRVLPFGLTPESVLELAGRKFMSENLTLKMAQAA
ncbi:MAG: hypothetical protein AB7E51_08500 [Pseudodesulfovibrio sp.]